jgi:hypothetical protein
VSFLKLILVCCATLTVWGQPPDKVNPDAAVIQDFGKRMAEYEKLHKTVEGTLPRLKPTASPEKIEHHEHELAHRIREARQSARQGDIFTPEISAEFRRLIALAMQGQKATDVKQSLRHAEPVLVKPLRVNHSYPRGVPLQSTPPTLLLNLPKLPPEVEYRIVGHDLILLDVKCNLIVDFIPNAVP